MLTPCMPADTLQPYELIFSVALKPDGRILPGGSDDHKVRLGDVDTGEH